MCIYSTPSFILSDCLRMLCECEQFYSENPEYNEEFIFYFQTSRIYNKTELYLLTIELNWVFLQLTGIEQFIDIKSYIGCEIELFFMMDQVPSKFKYFFKELYDIFLYVNGDMYNDTRIDFYVKQHFKMSTCTIKDVKKIIKSFLRNTNVISKKMNEYYDYNLVRSVKIKHNQLASVQEKIVNVIFTK